MEAAAGRSLVRDNSSVLTPVVLGMALIAQLAICRMSSNWEYRLPGSSPITQQRQRQQHSRDGLSVASSTCMQKPNLTAENWELVDSRAAGQLVLTLCSPLASQGQTMQ